MSKPWPRRRPSHAADQKRPIHSLVDDGHLQDAQEGQSGLLRDDQCGEIERSPQVSIPVTTPTYAGVSVDHPTIVATIKNLVKQGKNREEIMRIVRVAATMGISKVRITGGEP